MKRIKRQGIIVIIATITVTFVGGILAPCSIADTTDQQVLVDKARATFKEFIKNTEFEWILDYIIVRKLTYD